jgi:hypothetical protein
MFIQFIPGDSYAMSHETPLGTLFRGCGKQSGKPHERGTQFTSVGQDDPESLLIGAYVDSACIQLNH